MRRLRLLAVVALWAAGSCGGHAPTAPTQTSPERRALVLNSGSYTLSMSFARDGTPSCQNNMCTSVSLCTGTPTAVSSQYAMTVTRAGANAVVTDGAGTLALTLLISSESVSGTIDGSARDAAGITVSVHGNVTGSVPENPAIAVAGNIDGMMSVPGGGCANNGHTWSLSPR